jgi:glucosylglycerate synthase
MASAPDGPAGVDIAPLVDRLRLGLRELDGIWGLVLPPASRFALRRAATAAPASVRIDDALWARVVYDFAVAHSTRAVERTQLLRSMTPLYLGWVAGFVNEVGALDGPATEARVEQLCLAFEQEKRYLIGRWRWPDNFNP